MGEPVNKQVADRDSRPNNDYMVDVQRLVNAVLDKLWIVIISVICGVAITLLGTYYLVTPLYQSSAMFYVNNNALSVGDASLSLSTGDISAAKSLVDSYIVILQTRGSLNDVIEYSGVDYTYEELKDMISAAAVNSTEIFEVVVTSPSPKEAEEIANAIAYILPKRISSIIEGSSAEVVDYAVVAARPSSPNYVTNVLLGFFLGLVISVAVIVLQEMFDVTIRSEEDVEQCCSYPLLAAVPDMSAPSKGGYYKKGYGYGYDTTAAQKKNPSEEPVLVGEGISFAANEAYKLLRTKLQFSFADGNSCHVIGVSSAMAGEGKSLTSVNLSFALAQLDKRVLLIDCDMRRPSLNVKLPIQKVPGLSNFLTGHIDWNDAVQRINSESGSCGFDVVAAGRNPPNPIELLSSEKMRKSLKVLGGMYDYIILDLPPVGEVSDAMVVSSLADGILLVGRQNYCNRIALAEAIRQFEFVDTRILGLVLNCTSDHSGGYGKKYKYHKYYNKYNKSYYEAAQAAQSESETKEEV